MRKEILITNYNPGKLKQARDIAGIDYDYFDDDDSVNVDNLKMYENNDPIAPIDIFLLAYLFVIYREKANEKGNVKFLSLTSDILYPNPEGLRYQEFIIDHENYEGIAFTRKINGNISWVTLKGTQMWADRLDFWEKKRKEFKIEANHVSDAGIRQKVAFRNHPTKEHICLYSGTKLYVDYRYVSPSRLDKLNKIYDQDLKYYDLNVFETAALLYEVDKCKEFVKVLKVKKSFKSINELKNILQLDYVEKEYSPFVSPGTMANPPDRLDGYHSYNADVREITDSGRYKDNLKRYTQDRRVYEMWSGGNWKKADRLYATFVKNGVSPDHIGPMSLGFAHRPKFQPMTASQNCSKGNRMTHSDVKILIEDELNGEEVITWHSKYIWDNLKSKVENNDDALKLSALMRKNLHHVLIVFSIINENGFNEFLNQFLNPEFSFYDYEFENFDPISGAYSNVIQKKLDGKNQRNNVERYFRIAFEKLNEYSEKDNRKNKIWESEEVSEKVLELIELLKQNEFDEAKKLLHQIFKDLANNANRNW